jgi:hypothetical protein
MRFHRVAGLLLFAAAGCIWVARPSAPSRSRARLQQSVAGTYCFTTPTLAAHPDPVEGVSYRHWFPVARIAPGSIVGVREEGSAIVLAYTTVDGAMEEATLPQPGRWERGRYVADRPYANPFGAYRSRRSWIVYRLADDSLVLTDRRTDIGLTCLLLPTYQRTEASVVLAPSTSCGGSV